MKSVTNYIFTLLISCAFVIPAKSQQDVPAIFQETHPLSWRFSFTMRDVKRSLNDTIFFPSNLQYKNDQGVWDSLTLSVRARGNFRRKHCFFPPLRLKIKKSQSEGTPFEGNKSFKLVLPCQNAASGNTLILKEYLCYKLLEPVTPYFFHTRLVNLTLIDRKEKQSKSYSIQAFLIEDDDLIAQRFNGKVIDQIIPPKQLNDTSAVIQYFFEYLIANTDWSTTGQHNTKLIQVPPNKKVPLSYDFDMAGLVNAPYATINESLKIKSVKERLYRGYCRNESTTQYVRSEYLRLEPNIMKVINDHQSYFSESEYKLLENYIGDFFTTLKSDKKFQDEILSMCRTN